MVRMALASERHNRRRTRKGKSTWRWRTQETERSGIALLPFPLFPAEQLAAEDTDIRKDGLRELGKDILHLLHLELRKKC